MINAFGCCSLAGKVAYFSGDLAGAEMEYRHAVELKPQELPALEGLASVQIGVNSVQEGVATYARLVGCSFTVQYPILLASIPLSAAQHLYDKRNGWQVKLARTKSELAKQREFLWRAAEALDRVGDLGAAELQLKALLKMPLDSEEQRVEALCFLADLQVHTFACPPEPGFASSDMHACFCPPCQVLS